MDRRRSLLASRSRRSDGDRGPFPAHDRTAQLDPRARHVGESRIGARAPPGARFPTDPNQGDTEMRHPALALLALLAAALAPSSAFARPCGQASPCGPIALQGPLPAPFPAGDPLALPNIPGGG